MLAPMLLPPVMLSPMLSRIPAASMVLPRRRRLIRQVLVARQIDIDAALIRLGAIRQPHLAAQLLHARLDLLHMAHAMVALADDDVQVRLALLARGAQAHAHDLLGLVDVLAVQVDGVAGHAAGRIVLAEDVLGGLAVVVIGLGSVALGFDGEVVGAAAVAGLVGLLGLGGKFLALGLLVVGELAEAVVFAL